MVEELVFSKGIKEPKAMRAALEKAGMTKNQIDKYIEERKPGIIGKSAIGLGAILKGITSGSYQEMDDYMYRHKQPLRSLGARSQGA